MKDIWDALENEGHGESLKEEMFAWLSAYMDGETTPKERRLVEAYLREEPEAEAVLRLLRAAEAEMASESVDPPLSLRQAILSRTTRKRTLLPRALQWASGVAAAGTAAALLYVVSAGDSSNSIPRNTLATVAEDSQESGALVHRQGATHEVLPDSPATHRLSEDDGRATPESPRPAMKARRLKPTADGSQPLPAEDVERFDQQRDRQPYAPASGGRPADVSSAPQYVPAAYASEEPVTVRSEPKPVDPAAIPPDSAPQQESASSLERTNEPKTSEESQKVLPSARQKLRESLESANQERAAVTDSELNAPRKRLASK